MIGFCEAHGGAERATSELLLSPIYMAPEEFGDDVEAILKAAMANLTPDCIYVRTVRKKTGRFSVILGTEDNEEHLRGTFDFEHDAKLFGVSMCLARRRTRIQEIVQSRRGTGWGTPILETQVVVLTDCTGTTEAIDFHHAVELARGAKTPRPTWATAHDIAFETGDDPRDVMSRLTAEWEATCAR